MRPLVGGRSARSLWTVAGIKFSISDGACGRGREISVRQRHYFAVKVHLHWRL